MITKKEVIQLLKMKGIKVYANAKGYWVKKSDIQKVISSVTEITVSPDDDELGLIKIKDVVVTINKQGWRTAIKDGDHYLSKDGKIYMKVSPNHPAFSK